MGLFAVALLLVMLSLVASNSAETVRACIAAGGSGGGCPQPMFPRILFVVGIGAAGLGVRYWLK
jgi:hypothetical protein